MPWSRRTRRVVQLAALALGLALLFAAVYGRRTDTVTLQLVSHALREPAGTDSTFYMRLGERAFQQSGQRLYAQLFFAQHQKFIYPPSALFVIEAVDWLPRIRVSPQLAWKALMVASWLVSIVLAARFFQQQAHGRATRVELFSIALLGILFLPFAEAFFRGQVQMLLIALWGGAALCYGAGKKAWTGVLLALTCAFKPQLAIFLLWGLLRRERRFTRAFVATGAVIGAASLWRFGVQAHLDYIAVLRVLSRQGEALAANQSLLGALHRVFRNGDAATWSYTAYPPYRPGIYLASSVFSVACLLTGLVLPRRARWANTTADFLFFGCVSVLLSPIAWEHHYGYFLFPMVALLAQAQTLPSFAWKALSITLLAFSNRLPMLDGFIAGPASVLGDYLFLSAVGLLALFAAYARPGHPGRLPTPLAPGLPSAHFVHDLPASRLEVDNSSPALV